jgi:hypothetical protein
MLTLDLPLFPPFFRVRVSPTKSPQSSQTRQCRSMGHTMHVRPQRTPTENDNNKTFACLCTRQNMKPKDPYLGAEVEGGSTATHQPFFSTPPTKTLPLVPPPRKQLQKGPASGNGAGRRGWNKCDAGKPSTARSLLHVYTRH